MWEKITQWILIFHKTNTINNNIIIIGTKRYNYNNNLKETSNENRNKDVIGQKSFQNENMGIKNKIV